MLMNGCTDARTQDGQKVITIAHPEHSSGELNKTAGHALCPATAMYQASDKKT